MELASSLLSPVTAYAWPPLVSLSRRTVLSLFAQIKVGQLVVQDAPTNITTVCGALEVEDPDKKVEPDLRGGRRRGTPRAVLRVHSDTFWVRLLLFADMVRINSAKHWESVSISKRAIASNAVLCVIVLLLVRPL